MKDDRYDRAYWCATCISRHINDPKCLTCSKPANIGGYISPPSNWVEEAPSD